MTENARMTFQLQFITTLLTSNLITMCCCNWEWFGLLADAKDGWRDSTNHSIANSTVWPLFSVCPSLLSAQIVRCTLVNFPVCKCIWRVSWRWTMLFVTPMDWKLFFLLFFPLFFTSNVQMSCFLLVFFQRVFSKDHICSRQHFSFCKFCSFKVWF